MIDPGVIAAIAVALLFITIIGHGIWVFFAFVFRGFKNPAPSAAVSCPRCHSKLSAGRCLVCDWPLQFTAGKRSLASIFETREQIERFVSLGLLERTVAARILESLEAERLRLTTPPPPPLPAAAPLAIAELAEPASSIAQPTPIIAEIAPERGAHEATAPMVPMAEPVIRPLGAAGDLQPSQPTPRSPVGVHPLDQPVPIAAQKPPAAPRRPIFDLLSAFMEEQNIRWGELIGGLLIVGCSIALVISFWAKIAERPFLKFVVFNGVTAALFGLGFYAERRWRLRTTSRAVLLISILLVPLNFLAIAAFTEVGAQWLTPSTAGEAVSIFLFAALTTAAARIIAPRDVWPMVAGIMVPSVVQLLIRRWVNPATNEPVLLAIGVVPMAVYAAVNLFGLWKARNDFDETDAATEDADSEAFDRPAQTFALLGATSFAALLPLGLLLFKTGHPVMAVHQLAVLISAAGLTPLAVGLFLWQRLACKDQFARRISGLSVAVAGMLLLLAGVVLAWPEPASLVPAALLVAVVLSAVAISFRLPEIHFGSIACLMLVWLTVWHLAAGRLVWHGQDAAAALHAYISGASGQSLVPLVAVLFAVAIAFGRWLRRPADAGVLGIAAGGVAALSTALVSWFGFGVPGDPLHATWIYAIYGVATCAAAVLIQRGEAARSKLVIAIVWIGAALVLAACVQGVVYLAAVRWPLALPWPTGLMLGATVLCAAMAASRKWGGLSEANRAAGGFGAAAILLSAAALVQIAGGSIGLPHHVSAGPLTIHWLWLAAVWLMLALVDSLSRVLFPASQAALAVAVWFCVGIWLEPRPWFANATYPWLDPWTLQAEGIALAALCVAWMDVRRFVRGHRLAALFEESLPVDAILLRAVAVGLIALSCYAAWPGVAQELSPRAISAAGATVPVVESNFEILELPHIHAQAIGSWLLLAVVIAAFVAEASQRGRSRAAWIILALFMSCPLAASRWEPQLAVASAVRWYALALPILGAAAIGGLERWQSASQANAANMGAPARGGSRAFLVGLGCMPALVGAAYAFALTLAHEATAGPEAISILGRMGPAVSYAAPISIFALYLAALALWESSELLALAGGLMANLAATVAYVLRLAELHLPLDMVAWIGMAQLDAIVAAVYVLFWAVWRARFARREAASVERGPIIVLTALAGLCNLAVLAPVWLKIVDDPTPTVELLAAGGVRGWLAAGLTAIAICAAGRLNWRRVGSGLPTVVLFCVATLLAATALHLDKFNWLGYRTLLVAHATIGWLVAGLCWADIRGAVNEHRERVDRAVFWSVLASLVASVLAIRALFGGPHWPWWTIGALASQALLAVWLAWWSYRAALLYWAMPLMNLAASVWWFQVGGAVGDLAYVNVAALALPAIGWLAMELLRFRAHRRAQIGQSPYRRATNPAHRFAAMLSLIVLLLAVGAKLIATATTIVSTTPATVAEWIALATVVALWTAMLWDDEEHGAAVGLYFAGLAAAGVVLDQIHPAAKWLWWAGDAVLAAYAVATSFIWSRRAGLRALADQLRIPRGQGGQSPFCSEDYAKWGQSPVGSDAGLRWLVPVNCTLAVIVVALSYGFVLTYDDFAFRIVAAKAVLAQMLTLGLLARGERRSGLQYASLVVGVLGAVAIGWAALQPGAETLLNRTVVVAAALAIAAAIYGLGLTKLLSAGNEWLRAARRLTPVLISLDVVAVLAVLGVEIWQAIEAHHVAMSAGAIATMTALLAGLCAAALAAAVLPGRDPLGLSLRRRQAYVCAAEALLVLLFVHLRLCVPQWFHGPLEKFWPLVVQGIAFLGVGLGEMFRRQRRIVVGEPLANTGALLPILPVLGYWLLPARVDYSLLLLTVGLVYGALAVTRRSFGFGLLAVLAANGGLWFFLGGHEGFRFIEHPQLWMIPPALCVLIAAQLNRRQLTAEQMTAIRYASSIVIYVSSTADIFLQGVAHAPWLPAVLAGLSIVGVLVGIVVRVRAFLILGTSFLMLSILTMIWYAAVDLQQTWLWYAAGIVVGALILAVFAVFEKQRQAVTGLLDQLKKWQP